MYLRALLTVKNGENYSLSYPIIYNLELVYLTVRTI